MPQQSKSSTILRQHELLRMLTISRSSSKDKGHWDKASDLQAKLQNMGYEVSLRTVQRDLLQLSEIFSIELNDKNPRDYGWRWKKGAQLEISALGSAEAMLLSMARQHIAPLLPPSTLELLDPLFETATARLDQVSKLRNIQSRNWKDKIRVVQPTQQLIAPAISSDVQINLCKALLESRKVYASYQSLASSKPKEYELNPLGLILRGSVFYLVATAKNYSKVVLYALHRFNSVELLSESVVKPNNFSLDSAIQTGLSGFTSKDSPIVITLRVTEKLLAYLRETPLSFDQEVYEDGNRAHILKASVNDTWQLRWWLLSQGKELEVCEPLSLRNDIMSELASALKLYS
mgnify:CR=1 FL=1